MLQLNAYMPKMIQTKYMTNSFNLKRKERYASRVHL